MVINTDPVESRVRVSSRTTSPLHLSAPHPSAGQTARVLTRELACQRVCPARPPAIPSACQPVRMPARDFTCMPGMNATIKDDTIYERLH